VRGGYLVLDDSKTGPRRIPLAPEAQKILAELARVDDNEYVIAGESKDPIRNLHHAWHRLQERAGIEHARIHDLRHTYASNAVMHGVNIVMVSKLLGHLHIQTTMRYAHLADDPVREAAAEVGAILGRSLTTKRQAHASISELPKLRLPAPGKVVNAIEADHSLTRRSKRRNPDYARPERNAEQLSR
jgi:hypothetical protein